MKQIRILTLALLVSLSLYVRADEPETADIHKCVGIYTDVMRQLDMASAGYELYRHLGL